jgi:antitoxin component YwqK of YwqJK toxin-antitoxin module
MKTFLLICIVVGSAVAPQPRVSSPVEVVETRYESGQLQSRAHVINGRRVGTFETWWPNGNRRSSVGYLDDVFHGEYLTWTIGGKPYERKHFEKGRESGLQQSWDEAGQLYLNYEVKNGRRYGFTNAKPCLPANHDGTSKVRQP